MHPKFHTIMAQFVGRPAPAFTAKAVVNGAVVPQFSLSDFHGKNYVVLFFYPKDFSSLCPSELIAFQHDLAAFEERGAVVVGCSTDTVESHLAFLNTPQSQGGIAGVTYPLVGDANKTIATNYDVLTGEYDYDEDGLLTAPNELIAYRALFLIDKKGVVQHQTVNHLMFGRNTEEALRMLDALIHFETSGQTCPANWRK